VGTRESCGFLTSECPGERDVDRPPHQGAVGRCVFVFCSTAPPNF
jgi:hypothetical protein